MNCCIQGLRHFRRWSSQIGHIGAQMTEGLIDAEAQPRGDWKSRKSRNGRGWGKERLRPRQEMAGWAYWVLVLKRSGHAGVLPSLCLMWVKK